MCVVFETNLSHLKTKKISERRFIIFEFEKASLEINQSRVLVMHYTVQNMLKSYFFSFTAVTSFRHIHNMRIYIFLKQQLNVSKIHHSYFLYDQLIELN